MNKKKKTMNKILKHHTLYIKNDDKKHNGR